MRNLIDREEKLGKIIDEVKKLAEGEVGKTVAERIKQFRQIGKAGHQRWFSELCFCILAAGSSAKRAMEAQEKIGEEGFMGLSFDRLKRELKGANYQFPNLRAKYIVEARKKFHEKNIKEILLKACRNPFEMREWLVSNIEGVGYKVASHFLRNIGFFDFAILDQHILELMDENGLIKWDGRTPTGRKYLEYEKKLRPLATEVGMPLGVLDLYLWYLKTGKVLK